MQEDIYKTYPHNKRTTIREVVIKATNKEKGPNTRFRYKRRKSGKNGIKRSRQKKQKKSKKSKKGTF